MKIRIYFLMFFLIAIVTPVIAFAGLERVMIEPTSVTVGDNGAVVKKIGGGSPAYLEFEGIQFGVRGSNLLDASSSSRDVGNVISFLKRLRKATTQGSVDDYVSLVEPDQRKVYREKLSNNPGRWDAFQKVDQQIVELRVRSLMRYGDYWLAILFEIYGSNSGVKYLVPRIYVIADGGDKRLYLSNDLEGEGFLSYLQFTLSYQMGSVAAKQLQIPLGRPSHLR